MSENEKNVTEGGKLSEDDIENVAGGIIFAKPTGENKLIGGAMSAPEQCPVCLSTNVGKWYHIHASSEGKFYCFNCEYKEE